MKPTHIASLFAAPALLFSCENPADKTTDAKVSTEVAKTASVETGVKFTFDPASKVNFIGSKVTRSHHGGFKTFTGHFTLKDGEPVGNNHKVIIDMKSTWSDDEKLTGHLTSPDFFDVEKYPQATFDVTAVTKESVGYTVAGNFTFHGVTKNISFPATVAKEGDGYRIHSKFDINRKDFNIVYPGKPDDIIRDQVVIELDLLAKPQS